MNAITEALGVVGHPIRALYDEHIIRVYQAYSNEIADSALAHGTFVSPPFKMGRMTWIKPSFLWMMYRSGWGLKDAHQSRILAIDITRDGFDWALSHGCLSHPTEPMSPQAWQLAKANSPIRIQWDPERDLFMRPLSGRTIQIGLGRQAVELYVNQWIQKITDVTGFVHQIHNIVLNGNLDEACAALPCEETYLPSASAPPRSVS